MICINCEKPTRFSNDGKPIICLCMSPCKTIEFVECIDFMSEWQGVYLGGELVKEGYLGEVTIYEILDVLKTPYKKHSISPEKMDEEGLEGFPKKIDNIRIFLDQAD